MKKLRAFFWPTLNRKSEIEEEDERRRTDVQSIRDANWKSTEIIEFARQLELAENERRQSCDTKASIYMVFISAMVPIIGSLVEDFFSKIEYSFENPSGIISTSIFTLGMTYLLASGMWAFRTLSVSTYARVDIDEFLQSTKTSDPQESLLKDTLCSIRINRDSVNSKISNIKMAHEFLIRTFVTFLILILVVVLWIPTSAAFGEIMDFMAIVQYELCT